MSSGKVRIYELAKEFNLDNRDILAICDRLDIAVKSHSSTIDQAEAGQIISAIQKMRVASRSEKSPKSFSYQWIPISDLPENWPLLASDELEKLASIWREQANTLKASDVLREFNVRLAREWAIETGVLENLYSIDKGTTQLLIERGIEASLIAHGTTDKPPEYIVPILKAQQDALEGIFAFVAQRRELSVHYIRELHQALTLNQEVVDAVDEFGAIVQISLIKGQWKERPNNPTRPNGELHEYCPPIHVGSEMDSLIKMHLQHRESNVPPEVEAAWLHHRFTQIHPFQDGNGRVARALASLVFLRDGWFPLVINRELREDYITALEEADHGNLSYLIDLFGKIQKKAFVKALSLSGNILYEKEPVRQVISAGVERLKARKQAQAAEIRSKSFQISKELENYAFCRFRETSKLLTSELQSIDNNYYSDAEASDSATDFWFRQQIVSTARKLEYYADTRSYRAWSRLKIREERQAELVVSFHALGFEFVGVIAASAFIEYRDKAEDGDVDIDGPHVICDEVFQFSYNEDKKSVLMRFQQWLENVILVGLEHWRKQL
ncbi:MAG: translation initiation factor IF-2 N-terminal domain-containing protein [Nodosilinea sp.]